MKAAVIRDTGHNFDAEIAGAAGTLSKGERREDELTRVVLTVTLLQ
jgi:hypothetical protein